MTSSVGFAQGAGLDEAHQEVERLIRRDVADLGSFLLLDLRDETRGRARILAALLEVVLVHLLLDEQLPEDHVRRIGGLLAA